jgi:hypothetical protein
MEEMFNKILAILEMQDAKIKALEAQIEAYTGGTDALIDIMHGNEDSSRFSAFSERHKEKLEPYIPLMDKIQGGDSMRALYDGAEESSEIEGYDENAYVDQALSGVIETIEALKSIAPPEAEPALEAAQEAVEAAAEANEGGEVYVDEREDPATDEWAEEELEKEKLEGPKLF